jgi:parallel beta-helix repeat protein
MIITEDTRLEPGAQLMPDGITIAADGITLDGNGALLIGAERQGRGVVIEGHQNVTIKNLRLQNYMHGIYADSCQNLAIRDCQITATHEVKANTVFLDVWRPASQAYGGGIFLVETTDSQVTGNNLQHQMCGLLAYGCRKLEVSGNNASYCSGFGFHLYETSQSRYLDNVADYCCRYEPRGEHSGHMGADAAGFLIVHNSSDNVFQRNLARLGGDGFFLGGLTPDHKPVPCNNNLFEENDASYSPNIAFEATFSRGNIYTKNIANHCNYGFWLGFSRDGRLEGNHVENCSQAGIATENGFNFQVRDNSFESCRYAILLWSKHIPEFVAALPENTTSYNWLVENNTLRGSQVAIRIAANQDHGIAPYAVPEGEDPVKFHRPYDHTIRNNVIEGNRRGVQTVFCDRTLIDRNRFAANIEGDIASQ